MFWVEQSSEDKLILNENGVLKHELKAEMVEDKSNSLTTWKLDANTHKNNHPQIFKWENELDTKGWGHAWGLWENG